MFPSASRRKAPAVSIAALSIGLLAATLVMKAIGAYWIHQRFGYLKEELREFSYVASDYPETWPIPRPDVLMTFDNPKHFRLDSPDGIAEWKALVPGDGLVHLGPHKLPFSISMLHELKCLDIIRDETVRSRKGASTDSGPTELGRHCLNYVRQMVTCRGDLELESFQYASHSNPIHQHGVYQCKDWEAVYQEVKKNQEEHRDYRRTLDGRRPGRLRTWCSGSGRTY